LAGCKRQWRTNNIYDVILGSSAKMITDRFGIVAGKTGIIAHRLFSAAQHAAERNDQHILEIMQGGIAAGRVQVGGLWN
jgi:hypothetical protein